MCHKEMCTFLIKTMSKPLHQNTKPELLKLCKDRSISSAKASMKKDDLIKLLQNHNGGMIDPRAPKGKPSTQICRRGRNYAAPTLQIKSLLDDIQTKISHINLPYIERVFNASEEVGEPRSLTLKNVVNMKVVVDNERGRLMEVLIHIHFDYNDQYVLSLSHSGTCVTILNEGEGDEYLFEHAAGSELAYWHKSVIDMSHLIPKMNNASRIY